MRRLARLVFKRRPPEPLSKESFRKPKVLIFDFDGTVADTFEAGVRILNKLAPEFGYRVLQDEEVQKAKGMGTRQLMRFLGIKMTQMSRLARRGSQELTLCMPSMESFPDMPETLRTLHAAGYVLGIVTSNTEANVSIFLQKHGLDCFSFVQCSSKLMGKAHEFRGLLKRLQLQPHEVLSIGDEKRDIEAAHKVGIRIAAVTWGYNSPESLRELNPDYVFEQPRELVSFLEQLPAAS